ncbi:MAG: extracellular solute-binding protein [Candidatus Bathyarchaeia archaeon]|jgi:spermidine/putrescine-binding protein
MGKSEKENKPVDKSRRKLLIGAGAAVVVVAAGGAAYYLSSQAPPAATTTMAQSSTAAMTSSSAMATGGPTAVNPSVTLRYLGYPFFLPEDAVKQWQTLTGQTINATYAEAFVIGQKQLSNLSAWDFGGSLRHRNLVTANALLSMPIASIPRWQDFTKIEDTFIHPESYFSAAQAQRFNNLLWANGGQDKTHLISMPCIWNFDSVSYLPQQVPFSEHGGDHISFAYDELFNPEWKGTVGMQDEGYTSFTEPANLLNASGQLPLSGAISSMTTDEVDKVYNYLLPIIKSGQVRTFWSDYATIVNLLATKELYMASTWQPVCFDTRKAGTPCYYSRLRDGPFFWFNSNYMSTGANQAAIPDCLNVINWTQQAWMQLVYTRQGYPSPGVGWDDYHTEMGDEYYNWFFNGGATNLSITDAIKFCWPDHPEYANLDPKVMNALFTPDVYFKASLSGDIANLRTGSPDPNGNLRDLGSIAQKNQITRYFLSPDLPDNNDYYVQKYTELKALIPS